MRYFLRSFQIVLALLVFQSSSVFAEVYFWQDPVSKMSLTVPDTWRMSHDQKPDDVVTFLAPGAVYQACCTAVQAYAVSPSAVRMPVDGAG